MYKKIYYSNLNDVFDLVSKKNNKIGIGTQKEALPFEEIATSLNSRLNWNRNQINRIARHKNICFLYYQYSTKAISRIDWY